MHFQYCTEKKTSKKLINAHLYINMINQNFTLSQLSLNQTTSISPIFLLPILSISTKSSYYFNKISSSYSFSPFINGQKFRFLSVKYSKFSYFLSNALRIDKVGFFTPEFTKNCQPGDLNSKEIQIIGCVYETSKDSAIRSEDSNLSVFITDFTLCHSNETGGGICHRNGYLRTDSNNFVHCSSDLSGGGFYHSNGPIKIYRSSFNYNHAYNGIGNHFAIEKLTSDSIFMDFCYFSYLTQPKNDSLIYVRKDGSLGSGPVLVAPRFCRFNFTLEDLQNYINNDGHMRLVIGDDRDSNKFTDKNTFPGTIYPMREKSSCTFLPTPFFSPTQVFTETTVFTISECFTQSLDFEASRPFTPSSHFSRSHFFTSSDLFSSSSLFTGSISFTESHSFTQSLRFSDSFHFTPSSGFSPSSFFTSSNVFSGSSSFTPSQSGTPSYSPIPTRSPFRSRTPTEVFTSSNVFTPSSAFTPSNQLISGQFTSTNTFYVGPALQRATSKPLKGDSIMITLIVLGGLLLLLGLIANIILCVQMVQAGEIIITQRM